MTNTDLENALEVMIGSQEAEAVYIGSSLLWSNIPVVTYDCQIEYIESSGTQYIDTGIIINGPYKVEIEFETPTAQTSGYSKLMGVGNEQNAAYQYCILETDNTTLNKIRCSNRDYQNAQSISITLGSSSIHDIIIQNTDSSTISVIYNGESAGTVSNTSVTYSKASTGSLYLFTINNILDRNGNVVSNNYPTNFTTFKLHSFKFYSGEQLIRDMIPVRIGQIGYLYDKVSGQLFGNSGSGSFILGPDIVEIEYLENSSNQQYIDTKVNTHNNMVGIDCSINLGSYSHDRWGLGYNFYSNKDTSGFQIGCYNNNLTVGLYSSDDVGYTKVEGSQVYTNNTDYHIIINCLNVPISINGVTYGNSQLNNLGSSGGNIYLFRRNGNLNTQHCAKPNTKIFYCKIYTNNNTLIRDLVPVRIGQVGYMYDKVSNQLFGNVGSGDFVLGPDKT